MLQFGPLGQIALAQPSLMDGLVAYYPFDGNANDMSGHGYNGIVYGAIPDVNQSGQPSSSFKFTGTTNWIRLNIGSEVFTNDFTIATWVKVDDLESYYPSILSGDNTCVNLYVNGSEPGLISLGYLGKVSFYQWAPPGGNSPFGTCLSTTPLATNRWHHVAATRSGHDYRLYLDGNLSYSTNESSAAIPTGSYLQVGTALQYHNNEHFFHGNLDDLRIYNRALSSNEVESLFVQQAPPPPRFLLSSVTVLPGTNVILSATALGMPSDFPVPSAYQWLRNGVSITNSDRVVGESSGLLTIADVQPQDTGAYSVQITTSSGATNSVALVLTVLDGDSDGDGLPNSWEVAFGLNPADSADAQSHAPGDQLTYILKYRFGLNPLVPDTDGDGLSDYDEIFVQGTNPLSTDTDGDGMPDKWEVDQGLDPRVNDANDDLDLDGLSNLQEYQGRAAGYRADRADSLGDGRSDYERLFGTQTNRFYYDRNDRLVGADYNRGFKGFGIAYVYDGNGNLLRQKNLVRDANRNGLPDVWEFLHGLTNNASAYTDSDGDGWTDYQEWKAGTNPHDAAAYPDYLGDPGLNLASLTLPFTPNNFVVGVGQLDGVGADEIVIGADGDPGTNSNSVLVFTQVGLGWSTQRVDVGPFGVTSLSVGFLTNRTTPAIYAGLRQHGGTGRVVEFMSTNGTWQHTPVASSTNEAAFVLGLRGSYDLLVSYAPTNGIDGGLYGIASSSSGWESHLIDTNTSHVASGQVVMDGTNHTIVRSIDSGYDLVGQYSFLGLAPPGATNMLGSSSLFALTPGPMTWNEAQSYARQFSGNLVTIESQAKNDLLRAMFPTGDLWIGFYRPDGVYWNEGRWVSGAASSFVNWSHAGSGEPTYIPGREGRNCKFTTLVDRLATEPQYHGQWNDADDQDPLCRGIIEINQDFNFRTLPKPVGTQIQRWLGLTVGLSSLRSSEPTNRSVITLFTDDKNSNARVDAGDEFVLAEFLTDGTNFTPATLLREAVASPAVAQSYGLASVKIFNRTNDILFTGEPDGRVFYWTSTGTTNPLQQRLFSSVHAGKAWHALAAVKTLEPGEGLVGLRVDPAFPNKCDLILWPPQSDLPQVVTPPQTPPQAAVLPQSGIAGTMVAVRIRLWDAEGNASTPFLQYQLPGSTGWQDAVISRMDGVTYSPANKVPALPGGSDYVLTWNAGAVFTLPGSTNLLFRVRAQDHSLVGDWSAPMPYSLSIPADTDHDGLPDEWEQTKLHTLAYGAGDDPDLDGFTNLEEYLADTDPLDSASYLHMTGVSLVSGGLKLEWRGGVEATQVIQRNLSLDGSNLWLNIYTAVPPTAVSGSYTDLLSTNLLQFFRLKADR